MASDIAEVRPQALLLTFFGGHVLGRGVRVSTGSVLKVLDRVGVAQHAARSALGRMADHGLLQRHRRGRQVYLGLTSRSREILNDGEIRIWRTGVVNDRWDGTWTLLGFTVPESQRQQRHLLRSRLLWAGFGSLQGGLWIAPSPVEVNAVLEDIEAAEHVKVFQARAIAPTDVDDLVGGAWDLQGLAKTYQRFIERWSPDPPESEAMDALARQLQLTAEWLQILRQDPRLPIRHLPDDWPAEQAQRLFRRLHAALEPEARAIAVELLETIPDTDEGAS
ncbi:PaaX family transcriptional regulator [Glycomyces buryatensis]|uniref:PaaX family transcriptional regulator n=1 Tax=Glycomyces buryatensis TaxID=2570927 RepID=A0A4S8PXZ3_9ACTN|nr:PaaX family transcriptional regulator C-terminal domain-containing protein [Glycomyces buryatensis]THV36480.1 PaaX family transcriptional regulator [Glycomyces buryatensis]